MDNGEFRLSLSYENRPQKNSPLVGATRAALAAKTQRVFSQSGE